MLATVLRLLHRAGTCLVRKPSARTWTIRLAGLTDPRSSLHRALLRETATPFRFRTPGSPATAANSGPAQPEAEGGPVAGDAEASPAGVPPTATTTPSQPPTPVECLAGLCLALATQANAQRDALEVRVREQADTLALVTDELKSIKDEREGLHAELALRGQTAAEAVALAEKSHARFCELEIRLRENEEVQRLLRAQLASTGLLTTPTAPPAAVSTPLHDRPMAANQNPADSATTEAEASPGAIDPRPRGPPD
ncbi:MAG: hypothetical protein H6711_09575 [Myxococcales bacterium]|nr:hypothetical protein [Myxococcales bacterium]